MLTKAPRGTFDVLPEKTPLWRYIEETARNICALYGYKEIRTPVFEHTELFERGVGDTTDVVQKEMYTFTDKGDRSITLRPEGTAGAIRAYIENNIYALPKPAKLYYLTSCYRYEKPQAGRLREFHQFGAECVGTQSAVTDAELILLARRVLLSLGINEFKLKINSIGCPDCRKKYNDALKDYLKEYESELCETCKTRLLKNPMRILDCKSSICQGFVKNAPKLPEFLCAECSEHFAELKHILDSQNIPYEVDTGIVRGLDYYTKSVFEFITELNGVSGTVCGGGRYDGLVEELGGEPTPAIGFAMGIERIILAMEKANSIPNFESETDLFLVSAGEVTDFLTTLTENLREIGIRAERDLLQRSVKAQMKYADKIDANYTIVIGDSEIETGMGKIKNMKTGETIEIKLTPDAVSDIIRKG